MIKVVQGNAIDAVLNGDAHILLHIANCQGVMGSGVAKEVRQRIPSAFSNYVKKLKIFNTSTDALGSISKSDCYNVFNLHAQDRYGYDGKRYLNYGALVQSLMTVLEYDFELQDYFETGDLKIAIPYYMGSARAGGDWDTVCEIVEGVLGHHEITAYKL